jgi:hypothetical protein
VEKRVENEQVDFLRVHFRHHSQFLDVKITRAGSFTLYGDPAIVNL